MGIGLTLSLTACATPSPAPSIAPTPGSPTAQASASPTGAPMSAPPTASPTVESLLPSGPGAVEEPSLLGVLPADVGGVPVTLEHQAFLDAMTDRAFATNVRRAAFGVAVDGTDLVSGVVAELAPGRFTEAFFRDWRDTYNEGACAQAGGVVGNAEAEIDGRTVYIATCAGGLRTYHAWIPERGAIVSAFALGERRLGESLMEGLTP